MHGYPCEYRGRNSQAVLPMRCPRTACEARRSFDSMLIKRRDVWFHEHNASRRLVVQGSYEKSAATSAFHRPNPLNLLVIVVLIAVIAFVEPLQ